MERSEKLINIWNGEFPNYPLTVADLKKPHAMIGAFFQVFNRLGIDNDAVLSPPPEEERVENTTYYWDLLPIINMTRVINHVVAVLQQSDKLNITFPLTITHFLQPDAATSHSILLLLINLTAFNENRLRDIAPYEEELFGKREQVKNLEDKKNRLLELLNEQAEEKGKRAERLEKIEHDIQQFEEELKLEKEAHNEEKQALEAILEENRQLDLLIDQKKSQRDALLAEVARKKALRVYDAEDIKAQTEQAAQNMQEAEEKLNSLKTTLMQKENSMKNLQKIKPNFDLANNLLHEIMKLSEALKELELGDLDADSAEGELDVLQTELAELRHQHDELRAARAELARRHADHETKSKLQVTQLDSAIREAEEKEKKSREDAKKSLEIIEEIKERTTKYAEEKKRGLEELELIERNFCEQLKSYEDALLRVKDEAQEKIEERLRGRHR